MKYLTGSQHNIHSEKFATRRICRFNFSFRNVFLEKNRKPAYTFREIKVALIISLYACSISSSNGSLMLYMYPYETEGFAISPGSEAAQY